jgi:hypothetical protein
MPRHRSVTLATVLSAAALGLLAPAAAQPRDTPVAGAYQVKFDPVANNCSGVGMSLTSARIELAQPRGRSVSVTIPSVPIMSGTASSGGKFRASVKRGKTAIEGVDGRFSVAGRVEKGTVQFLFIAEYFRGARPLCTQSWNASGPQQ